MEDADDLFHRCDYHCLNQWQSRQLSISAIWIVFSLCHLPSGVNIEPSINRNQYHLLQQQSQVEGLWKVIEHYLVSYIHHNLHQQQACTSRYFLNIHLNAQNAVEQKICPTEVLRVMDSWSETSSCVGIIIQLTLLHNLTSAMLCSELQRKISIK